VGDQGEIYVAASDLNTGDVLVSREGARTWKALGCPGAEIHALAADASFLYCGATALTGARGMWRLPLSALELDRQ